MNSIKMLVAFKKLISALNREFFLLFAVSTVAVSICIAQAIISLSDKKWEVRFLVKPGQVATLSQSTLFGLFLKNQEGPTRHLTALRKFDTKNEIFQRLKNQNIVETAMSKLFPKMSYEQQVRTANLLTSSLKVASPRDTAFLELIFDVYELDLAEPLITGLIKEVSAEQNLVISKYKEQLIVIRDQITRQLNSKEKQLDFVNKKLTDTSKLSVETVMLSMLRENLERDFYDFSLSKMDVENALQPEVTYETKLVPHSMANVVNPISPAKDFIYILAFCFAIGLIVAVRKAGEFFDKSQQAVVDLAKQGESARQIETGSLMEVNH